MDTYQGEMERITKMNYYQQTSYQDRKFQDRCEQEGQIQVRRYSENAVALRKHHRKSLFIGSSNLGIV